MERTVRGLMVNDYLNTYTPVIHGILCGDLECCEVWPPYIQTFSDRYNGQVDHGQLERKTRAYIHMLDCTAKFVNNILKKLERFPRETNPNIELVLGYQDLQRIEEFYLRAVFACEGVAAIEHRRKLLEDLRKQFKKS